MSGNPDHRQEATLRIAFTPLPVPSLPAFLRPVAPGNRPIGQFVPGKGVFIGAWSPKDRDGRSLHKTFNLFAAPYDLGLDEQGRGSKLVTTYNKAVAAVHTIINLMGFAGFKGNNDTDLYNALRDGSYAGEWFIPTKDILHGKDRDGNAVQNDHLFGNRNTGALAGTLTTVYSDDSVNAHQYWSCSEPRYAPFGVWVVRFTGGDDFWSRKDGCDGDYFGHHKVYCKRSTRLVRAEPVSP